MTFVTDVLFPFARQAVEDYLRRHAGEPELAADLERLRSEHAADERAGEAPPPWTADPRSAAAYVHFLMDRDRKSTGLKALQGRIWEEGYRSGRLRGEVFPDVAPAFRRWREQGRAIAIYSSGSVLAQRLLFGTTRDGDLTAHISAFFDTATGPKREALSYGLIAAALRLPPRQVLFLSDVVAELDAAGAAGMRTALCVRGGRAADTAAHPRFTTLDGL